MSNQPRGRRRDQGGWKGKSQKPVNAKTVVFVPRTPGGALFTKLREVETSLEEVVDSRYKLVEEYGVQMRRLLVKKNPWDNEPCGRPKCTSCTHEEGSVGACRKKALYTPAPA